jgi:hypothetical protein
MFLPFRGKLSIGEAVKVDVDNERTIRLVRLSACAAGRRRSFVCFSIFIICTSSRLALRPTRRISTRAARTARYPSEDSHAAASLRTRDRRVGEPRGLHFVL